MRQQRVLGSLIGITMAAVGTVGLTLGAAPAGATTRLRSGALHAQLASHISSSSARTGAGTGPLAHAGANVMATVVALLAVVALAYMVVTLIRRRISPA